MAGEAAGKLLANRIREWTGPFEVAQVEPGRKHVYIRDCLVGPARPFGYSQVKPYLTSANNPTLFCQLRPALRAFSTQQHKCADVFMTEIISANDPRAAASKMKEAKRKEIRNFLERGTFKVISKEEVPPDANVLPGRFVLAIKSMEDGKEKWKAR